MDIKQIQELVKMINKTNVSEISIEEEGFKITIKQKDDAVVTYASAPTQQVYQAAPLPAQTAPSAAPPVTPKPEPAKVADNTIIVRSPMIGTFYQRSSPDKPAFAEVGTDITPGKTICIIEAMKLFNEIESEVSGKVLKVLVEDSSPVEYDQPLFLVEPK